MNSPSHGIANQLNAFHPSYSPETHGSPWPKGRRQVAASSVRLGLDGTWNGWPDVASGAPIGLALCEKEAFFPRTRWSGNSRTRPVLARLPPTLHAPQRRQEMQLD